MASKKSQKSNVPEWLKREAPHIREALETASRHFDRNDILDVHTLEALYGQESSFGQNRRQRNIKGATGDFQMESDTAKEMGLHISEKDDERFDIGPSSAAAAKYLKILDNQFRDKTTLIGTVETIPIENTQERKKFDFAAYNGGASRIAQAQKLAHEGGDDPTKWDNVQKYLERAGATKDKAKEIREYVDNVSSYEAEFDSESHAKSNAKYKKSKSIEPYPKGSHWITIHGKHILIKD
jgi:membrane-bound lytic murein transglycosylase MltF